MKNNIIVINNINLVKFHNEDFYFDECRIYDNSFIEFYINGNIAIYMEYKKIEIKENKTGKLIRAYYGKRKTTDYDMIDLYIDVKVKDNPVYSIGDIIIRKNFNTEKGVRASYDTYRDENIFADSSKLFFLGVDKEIDIFKKYSDEEINFSIGWKIVERLNDRIVKIQYEDKECFELIRNITTLDKIKKEIEEWNNIKE